MSGFDICGIAQTGSGKTAAFLLPMLVHIMDQPGYLSFCLIQLIFFSNLEVGHGGGPIALVLTPTRELGSQIYQEAKKFAKAYRLHVASALGGASKAEQVFLLSAFFASL
jgi:ATP-dependent RNA helicase DDX42